MGIDDYQPSWMEDGGGVSGGSEYDPEVDYEQSYPRGSTIHAAEWDTTVTSRQNQTGDDPNDKHCKPPGADTSKIYVSATHYVDGKWKCYWIETTDCA